MVRHSALVNLYGIKAAMALHQAKKAKQQLDLVRAQLSQDFREDGDSKGVKLTERAIEDHVTCHPKYQEAVSVYHDSVRIADMAESVVEAFKQRRDMIVNRGKVSLEEMKGSVRVMNSSSAFPEFNIPSNAR